LAYLILTLIPKFYVPSCHLLLPKSFKMPMTWNADANAKVSLNCQLPIPRARTTLYRSLLQLVLNQTAKLFAAVMKTCSVKLDYQALGAEMGKGKFLYPFSRTSIDTDF
jgi:hypothetical protein